MRPGVVLVAMLAALVMGCATRPVDRIVVNDVHIVGATSVDTTELSGKLATQSSPELLGMTLSYEIYDRFVVERDIQRIERYYRARGFYEATVRAGRVTFVEPERVDVTILVEEGPPTLVSAVRIQPDDVLSADANVAIAKVTTLAVGARFDEDAYTTMKQAVVKAINDHGYAYASLEGGFAETDLAPDGGHARLLDANEAATVGVPQPASSPPAGAAPTDPSKPPSSDPSADPSKAPADAARKDRRYAVRIDAVHRTAEIFLRVKPGPVCTFGPITIEGAGDLPLGQLRAAIGIRRGSMYSTTELESARHALQEVGLFSSVEFVTPTSADQPTEVPITFRVARAPLHTLTIGGGLLADTLQSDAHMIASYEHLNFLGGLRKLTMQARPGLVFFPTNLQNALPPERVLPEFRGRAELRQPQFLEARTRATLRSEVLVYPFLLPARTRAEVPDALVGYRELREAAGLDRTFFRGKLALSTFYNLQVSYPFAYFGPLDNGINRVLVSYVSFGQTVDFRDNAVDPHKGFYFANELQVAGGVLGGDAADIKIQPDLRGYIPLGRRFTLAARASVGFLFPRNYGNTLSQATPDSAFDPIGASVFDRERNRDLQLLFFRAFFSGGPYSNRGYPLRGVGPRGIAPFALGGGVRALRDCVGRVPAGTGVSGTASQIAKLPTVSPDLCGVSLGGLSLWESSLELRFQITENLSTLVFLDGSDVTRERLSIRLDYPHLSTGSGLRYLTPVGPVRLDIGYAIPGLQRIGGTLDPTTEGTPALLFGTIPIAVNIAVGQAF